MSAHVLHVSSALKVHALDLNKESWENVPEKVLNTFKVVSTNTANQKKWCDRVDEKLKALSDQDEKSETLLSTLDASLENAQEQFGAMTQEMKVMQQKNERERQTFTACIKGLLDATVVFYEGFISASGKNLKERQSSEEQEDELEAMMGMCRHLEGNVSEINSAFADWAVFRNTLEEKNEVMRGKVTELHGAHELTRNRLLSWRDILKQTQTEVGALNSALHMTQNDVAEIQRLQVTDDDVHIIYTERSKTLEDLHNQTAQHVVQVQGNLDSHVGNVTKKIDDLDQNFQSTMESHNSNMKQLLQQSLDPVTAYLNNMHVKADVVRVEVDQLLKQVPKLGSEIIDVSSRLKSSDAEGRERSASLSCSLDDHVQASEKSFQRTDAERTELSDTLHNLCQQLGSRQTELRSLLDDTSQALEIVRYSEMTNLGQNLMTLEQKVAKWVHSSPMPAKVSEARLYALEAKMADEMEHRLQLESEMKDGHNSSCISRGPPLPSLPPSRPNTQGRPRSKQRSLREVGEQLGLEAILTK
jgi:chromosome segregation ATPase